MRDHSEALNTSSIQIEIRRRIKSWHQPVLYVLHNREMQEKAQAFWTYNMVGCARISDRELNYKDICFTFDNHIFWSVKDSRSGVLFI
jgi:hypothetical protein